MTNRIIKTSNTPMEFIDSLSELVNKNKKSIISIICVVVYDDEQYHTYAVNYNQARLQLAANELDIWAKSMTYTKQQISEAKTQIKQEMKLQNKKLSAYSSYEILKTAIAYLDAKAKQAVKVKPK